MKARDPGLVVVVDLDTGHGYLPIGEFAGVLAELADLQARLNALFERLHPCEALEWPPIKDPYDSKGAE